jgi:heme-degrading monooxygenase HmoA
MLNFFVFKRSSTRGVTMTAKIIIRRNVPELKVKELNPLLKQMRNICMNQPGYISGETLKSYDDPSKFVVISTWESVADWNRWVSSSQRMEIQSQIDYLLGEQTEYGIYVYA